MSIKNGINSLTSLRFFAALLVFVDHYFVSLYSPDWALALGYIAMTFFFTLSGFVLAYAYNEEFAQQKITRFKFYIGRIARIWPLHMLCIAITMPFVLTAFTDHFAQSTFYLIVNILLLHDIVPHSANLFNEPSWSISAEMFFYLCFPFLIMLAQRWKKIFILLWLTYLTVLSFIAIHFSQQQSGLEHNIVIFNQHISLAGLFYVFPPLRLLDFMSGIFLFFVYKRISFLHLGKTIASSFEFFFVILLIASCIYHAAMPALLQLDLIYLPTVALLLVSFSLQQGLLSQWLRNPILLLLGEASFAFYMLQEPVSIVMRHTIIMLNEWIFQGLHFSLLLILAITIHKYFEYPCYRYIRKYFGINPRVQMTKQPVVVTLASDIVYESS